MDLYGMPEHVTRSLRSRNVDPRADRIVNLIITALAEAAALVAQDHGPDRFDNAISDGGTRWQRARNILEYWLGQGLDTLAGLRGVDDDNAFHMAEEDLVVCFYSARDGIDQPDLGGGSKAKKHTVDEMQLQIKGLEGGPVVNRLALLYEADDRGLREVAVGVLESVRAWHWRVVAFRRDRDQLPASRFSDETGPRAPGYSEQAEPVIPPIEPIQDGREEGDQNSLAN